MPPLVWRAPHPETPAANFAAPTLAAPAGDRGAHSAARAAVAAWAMPSSPPVPTLPDTGRIVDEVMRRLDQRLRSERLRRGI